MRFIQGLRPKIQTFVPWYSVAGSVGYTAQDPWICNATLKDNILMGHDFEEARYQQVVLLCCHFIECIAFQLI